MAKKPRPNDLRPLMTRVPERLRKSLEQRAKQNDRSMNSEIIERLEKSIEADQYKSFRVGPDLEQRLTTAAEGTGRTLQQEIENLVESTFFQDRSAGGIKSAALFREIP